MKKLLFAVALLIAATVTAQTPTNYDGGSELQRAIKNAKNKKPAPKTTKTITRVETTTVHETHEEKLYRIKYGHSHPDFVKRVLASKGYQDEVAETKRLEAENEKRDIELQRKTDSINKDKVEKSKQSYIEFQKRNKEAAENRSKQDSITNAQRNAEQRELQKANRKRGIFR